jgi:chemotaxis protein methyltransferase CheR
LSQSKHPYYQGKRVVSDAECTAFLQWALPQLDLRWAGFRKVRGQVCKRLKRRMAELGLEGFAAYRARLEADPQEWRFLDESCHITISRFFRDRGVFAALRERVLPEIAVRAKREGRDVRCWSAGCASGEEPYTLKILWDLDVANNCPGVGLSIIATDIDATMLQRAREGCFAAASLRELPPNLVRAAFDRVADRYCVCPHHREGITFLSQDLRTQAPSGLFDLVLCRYVAFTYFAIPLQQHVLAQIMERLLPGGYLVIGTHERLPEGATRLAARSGIPQIFQVQDVALDRQLREEGAR